MKAMQKRVIAVVLLFAIGFTVVSSRLVYLQMLSHDYYREEAIKMHYVAIPIAPRRGKICDNLGHILAQSVLVTDLRVDGKLAAQKPEVFEKLAPILGISVEQLRSVVRRENRFALVQENLSDGQLQKIRSLKFKSLILNERTLRIYPNGHEASQLLGFVNAIEKPIDMGNTKVEFEVGVSGVERTMDCFLKGIPGERRVARDASKKEVAAFRQWDRPARDGLDVVLTIDQVIQHIVEVEAERLMQEYQPQAVHIIVLKPTTGEILAMTGRPTFDPNDRRNLKPEQLRNRSLMDTYEPGSTFKIVTLTAALNENMAYLDMPIYCENGKFLYAGSWLRDHHPYGLLTLRQVLAKSSNIGFAKLAILIGKEKVYEYAQRFGFGQPTQKGLVFLPGEENGILHGLKKWSGLSITHIPMGYEVGVTHLQMALAYASVANGGKLMEPRLVKAVVDSKGAIVAQYMPRAVRQVMRPEVAAFAREALKEVVSDEGTAQKASVPGFVVAGKTGTAQKLVDGSYDRQHYIASFIGFLPADNPQFLVSIVVDQPKGGKYYGGMVAAPAFSAIASQVADQLQLTREGGSRAFALKEDGL